MEIWKDVIGSGKYQVSNLGRIRNKLTDMLLKHKNRNGYRAINLCENSIRKTKNIHRLVIEAFYGESDLQVNHINGIKTDNRLENLEYVTALENIRHGIRIGIIGSVGETNYNCKLSDDVVRLLRADYLIGSPVTLLKLKYSISETHCRHLVKYERR